MSCFRVVLGILSAAISLSFGQVSSADLLAAGAKVDITPDVSTMKTPLGGYTARKGAFATGVHDPIYARSLVFSDGKARFGIVSVDICFIPAVLRQLIQSKIAAAGVTDLTSENLTIAATHSHTSPDPLAVDSLNTSTMKGWTTYSMALAEFEAEQIAKSVILANKRLLPAKIGTGSIDLPGSNRNRRNEKITDNTMSLVRILDDQGRSLGAIINYAAHPTLYDDKMMQISADWPGVMCGALEQKMGGDAVVMFLNGAEGDAAPNGATGDTSDARVLNYGLGLANKAWDVLRLMQTQSTLKLESWRVTLTLPVRKANGLFVLAARSFGATMAQAQDIVKQLLPAKTSIGYFRIGDFLMVSVPCEPTGEIGLSAKKLAATAGYPSSGIVALADDWIAYVLTTAQYREGNYEAGMSFYGDQMGPELLKGIYAGLQSHRNQSVKK